MRHTRVFPPTDRSLLRILDVDRFDHQRVTEQQRSHPVPVATMLQHLLGNLRPISRAYDATLDQSVLDE
jgi:hypothetical protein